MPHVSLDHRDSVTTVTVRDEAGAPSQRESVLAQLTAALATADHASESDAILLRSERASFGLGEPPREQDGEAPLVRGPGWRLLYRMLEMEKPLVCIIESDAIDLGLAVALLCDTAIAADSAVLGCRGVGDTSAGRSELAVLLPLYVGPQRAKEMLIAGELLSGADAHRLGLVNRVSPTDELLQHGEALSTLYASRPRFAARATKVVINRYIRWMADELADVAMAFEMMARSPLSREE